MKLSLESYVLRKKFGDFEGCRIIKEAGFDCVDMSYYWLPEGSPMLADGYREYAASLREHLDAIGLACNQAHAPFDVKYGEALDVSNPHYLSIVRAMESASILGAKAIVVHTIYVGASLNWQYNFDFFKGLQPFAEKFGIAIAVENLFISDQKRQRYTGTFATPTEHCDFVRKLNSPHFVACVDVGHAAMTFGEPEDFVSGMDGKLLQCLHIQDGDFLKDRHTLPYLGAINWENVMASLKKIGYTGELTFEIICFLGRFPDALILDALALAEKTGRYLISLFENA